MYRSERFEMRLSARDAELLDTVRGSASRAAWLRTQIHLAAAVAVETVSTNAPDPVGGNLSGPTKVGELRSPPTGPAPGARHRHTRGEMLSTRMVKGSRINVYQCKTCPETIEG